MVKYCEHCGQRECHCVVRPISRRVGPAVRGPRLVVSNSDSCRVGYHVRDIAADFRRALGEDDDGPQAA